jgi:hypothetical protein
MLAHELRHLEHAHAALAAEDCLERRVGVDLPLVLGVLELVLLDVDPELLGDFGAGGRASTR